MFEVSADASRGWAAVDVRHHQIVDDLLESSWISTDPHGLRIDEQQMILEPAQSVPRRGEIIDGFGKIARLPFKDNRAVDDPLHVQKIVDQLRQLRDTLATQGVRPATKPATWEVRRAALAPRRRNARPQGPAPPGRPSPA